MTKPDKLHKTKHPAQGEKEGTRKEDPSPSQKSKKQNPKYVIKG
jgi:hypothetical protein